MLVIPNIKRIFQYSPNKLLIHFFSKKLPKNYQKRTPRTSPLENIVHQLDLDTPPAVSSNGKAEYKEKLKNSLHSIDDDDGNETFDTLYSMFY